MSDFRTAPLNDCSEERCSCARCGSSVEFDDCWSCGGDGYIDEDYDDDLGPDWVRDSIECRQCGGTGGHLICLSDAEWCNAHPIAGREALQRGVIEWFSLPPRLHLLPNTFTQPVRTVKFNLTQS